MSEEELREVIKIGRHTENKPAVLSTFYELSLFFLNLYWAYLSISNKLEELFSQIDMV